MASDAVEPVHPGTLTVGVVAGNVETASSQPYKRTGQEQVNGGVLACPHLVQALTDGADPFGKSLNSFPGDVDMAGSRWLGHTGFWLSSSWKSFVR